MPMQSMIRHLRRGVKRAGSVLMGALAVGALKGLRLTNLDRMANFAGWLLRTIGPLLPEQRIARANLKAAFPENSAAEIESILRGTWDNLGRMGAEFANLDRLWDFDLDHPERGRITSDRENVERFLRLAHDGKPALIFAAHLGNWELPAISAAAYGADTAVLYRKPNIAAIDRWLQETRAANMGELIPAGLNAPLKLAEALQRGAHVGMLVDQYYLRGVEVTFFGRRTMANPLLARLARHFDCPIHGTRIVRLPGHRLCAELSEEIAPVRDAEGKIDIAGTMQTVSNVVEGWIREHPEQWLWLHRRWRPQDEKAISN
jgi:Kdo2-lipid IVA lauroyltransferase/acyltransferase